MELDSETQVLDAAAAVPETSEFIRAHYQMQQGNWISSCKETADGIHCYSDISAAPLWNHSAWIPGAEERLQAFASEASTGEWNNCRRPTIYCVQSEDANASENILTAAGYERFDQEVWMLYSPQKGANTDSNGELKIVEAKSTRQIQDFIAVFSEAYQLKDSGFADLLKRQAQEASFENGLKHYVAYAENVPVCTATTITLEDKACIYDVGTSPGARNRGYGKALIEFVVREALAPGVSWLFLQVTRGGAAERLYRRLGFVPLFARTGYRLKRWDRRSADANLTSRLALETKSDSHSRRSGPSDAYQDYSVAAPAEFKTCIQELAARARVSPHTIVAGLWANLLSRYSNEETVSFRLRLDRFSSNPSVNLCVIAVPGDRPVIAWLAEIHKTLAESDSESSKNSLESNHGLIGEFETLLDLNDGTAASEEILISQGCSLGLVFDPERFETLRFRGHSQFFDKTKLDRVSRHLLRLAANMVQQPEVSLAALEMITSEEREQVLFNWNPRKKRNDVGNLKELFEAQVARTPGASALILAERQTHNDGDKTLTYEQLNRRANRIAHYLQARRVEPNVFIGLCVARSLDLVAALLAIWKAGGVAVPLDPAYPQERLAYMIRDTQLPLILTDRQSVANLAIDGVELACLDELETEIASQSVENPVWTASEDALAYVIYTSGSTGLPKGVLISHSAIALHSVDMAEYYEIQPSDKILQFSSFNFDAALEQLLPGLTHGACIVMRGPEVWNSTEFAHYLCEYSLTAIDVPTAYWHQLAQDWSTHAGSLPQHRLRLVIAGGEAMSPETIRIWSKTPMAGTRLVNAYGPTEATITATTFEVKPEAIASFKFDHVPIGKPRGDRTLYILDRFGHLAPVGGIGELHIGGELLARGYLNRADLSKSKFISDPFSQSAGARLYRTGDLVRYLPDGNIAFLGRVDDQVKVRGFRVELGEIETALMAHSEIRQAAVVARSNDRSVGKELVAYFIPKALDRFPSVQDLRYFLKQTLPDYMIPSAFVMLEQLPLSPSGKVDRNALPAPQKNLEVDGDVFRGPSDPLELRLQLVFEKILQRRPIAVDVSFFELGGDSLQALELIVAVERISGKNLPLETLYQASSIEGIARILRGPSGSAEWSSLVPLQPSGSKPPFFLIHTTPGDIIGYGNLVYHLSSDQPCYGFQSLGLHRPEQAHQTIEQMAEYYVDLLTAFQPHGPYYLGGWCYGGIVAVEMAQQLMKRGESVALLALLETVAQSPTWSVPAYYLRRWNCFLRMGPARWISYLRNKASYYREAKQANQTRFRPAKLNRAEGVLSESERDRLARLERVYNTNLEALDHYRGSTYPGRVTLFNASVIDPALIPDPYYGWYGLASEIEIHPVPGSHDTMLAEPNVSALAEELEQCLRRAQNLSRTSREATDVLRTLSKSAC